MSENKPFLDDEYHLDSKIPMMHQILCHVFALQYAQQHGWFQDIKNYRDVDKNDYGFETYKQGLNIAEVTYKFWSIRLLK